MAPAFIDEIKQTLKTGNLTLVYVVKDEPHNNAQELNPWLEQKMKPK